MIGSTRRIRVHMHRAPCDMRKSFDTLAALVTSRNLDVVSGDLFLFVGKDRKRAKVLLFDGTGLCIYAKRLSKGRFAAAWEREEMTHSELALFLEGGELVGRMPVSPPAVTRADLFLTKSAFS